MSKRRCKIRHNRTGCNLQVVRIQEDDCKTAQGGTPTVKSPQYKLFVSNENANADKPTDISAI